MLKKLSHLEGRAFDIRIGRWILYIIPVYYIIVSYITKIYLLEQLVNGKLVIQIPLVQTMVVCLAEVIQWIVTNSPFS